MSALPIAQKRWDRFLALFLGRVGLRSSAPCGIGSNNTDSGTRNAFANFRMLRIDGLRSPRSMPARYVLLIVACSDNSC